MLFKYLLKEELQFESKAYRNSDMISKYSVKELSEVCFLMFLILELLGKTKFHDDAKKYAIESVKYPLYDRIYLSGTDLANVMSTLKNAKEYLHAPDVDIPINDLKRYLRDFKNSNMSYLEINSTFYKLQTKLKIKDATLLSFRRNIVDDQDLTWDKKRYFGQQLYQYLRRLEYKADIMVLLQKLVESNQE